MFLYFHFKKQYPLASGCCDFAWCVDRQPDIQVDPALTRLIWFRCAPIIVLFWTHNRSQAFLESFGMCVLGSLRLTSLCHTFFERVIQIQSQGSIANCSPCALATSSVRVFVSVWTLACFQTEMTCATSRLCVKLGSAGWSLRSMPKSAVFVFNPSPVESSD